MLTFCVCALLLCNLVTLAWLLSGSFRKGSVKGAAGSVAERVGEERTAGDGSDGADLVRVVRVERHEAAAVVLTVEGRFCDADPADIMEPEVDIPPEVVPHDRLDEVFGTVCESNLEEDEPEVAPPCAEGLDFAAMQKTVRAVRGGDCPAGDMDIVRTTIPRLEGTEFFERLALDPEVRKRIMMIECSPSASGTDTGEGTDGGMADDGPGVGRAPAVKIPFHADLEASGLHAIDFNIIR